MANGSSMACNQASDNDWNVARPSEIIIETLKQFWYGIQLFFGYLQLKFWRYCCIELLQRNLVKNDENIRYCSMQYSDDNDEDWRIPAV